MPKGFIFANNIMLDTAKSLKRTDDVKSVILQKLDHIISQAESEELVLVLCGTVFTKTFCVKALSECLERFKNIECLILADQSQMSGNKLNPKSTLGILDRIGLARALYGNEISKRVEIDTEEGELTYGVVGNRQNVLEDEIVIDQGLFNDMECIFIGDFAADIEFDGLKDHVKPYEVKNCTLVVSSGYQTVQAFAKVGKSAWASAGNVVRHHHEQEKDQPSYLRFVPGEDPAYIEIPHEEFVFDQAAAKTDCEKAQGIEKSNFARRLKEECSDNEVFTGKLSQDILDHFCNKQNVSSHAREIIYDLEKRYHLQK